VDAAVALKNRGHEVVLFTSRHDKNRCFEETRDGQPPVLVVMSVQLTEIRHVTGQCPRVVYSSVTTPQIPHDYRLFDLALGALSGTAVIVLLAARSGITAEPSARHRTF
jgi:hypothetical protein